MSYFLSAENLELNKQLEISGDEARHILFARRIRVGEKIVIQGPDDNRFLCEVVSFTKKLIVVKPLEKVDAPKEPDLRITLFQALIAEQALDYILQKSTELGVANIIIFNSKYTPAHLKEKAETKKARWQKILQEAAKQSNRLLTPRLEFFQNLQAALQSTSKIDRLFLLEKNAEQSLKEIKNVPGDLGILIGPEGGFTNEELESLRSLQSVTRVRLGPRVLRADTAAVSATAIIQSLWGDM